MPTEIAFTLARLDIALARLYVYFRSGWGIGIAALGIFLSVTGYLNSSHGVGPGVLQSTVLPAFVALVAVPLGVALGGINSPQIKKLLSGPITYLFLPDQFVASTAWSQANTKWTEIRRAYRTRTAYLISARGVLHVIPIRCLSAQQQHGIAQLLAAVLGARARFPVPPPD